MCKNVGTIDRILRIIIGVAIIAYGIIDNSLIGVIGLIPLFTAAIGWCPLYIPFKLSTCSKKECDTK